jgi:triosephosphate isomerase (TIM)
MRRQLVVGNWKMQGSRLANAELLSGLLAARPFSHASVEVVVCPPAVYLSEVAAALANSSMRWGAQDVSAHPHGAFTGEISAAMLQELGCRYALVGHSERRAYHAESDLLVAQKAQAALSRGITPIVCVGETLVEREAGQTETVVKRQLSAVIHKLAHCAGEMVVAYEPVWAIGTGRTATPDQAQAVHAVLRAQLQAATGRGDQMCILYGGSVKPDNAAELFAQTDIDGGLIGGASLKATDFAAICGAAQRR